MAALYIAGIDNALIETNAEEIPIMDGSARDFLKVFNRVKTKSQLKKRKYLKVEKKVELTDGERSISIEPHDHSLEVEFQLNYENKIIGKQKMLSIFQKMISMML